MWQSGVKLIVRRVLKEVLSKRLELGLSAESHWRARTGSRPSHAEHKTKAVAAFSYCWLSGLNYLNLFFLNGNCPKPSK